MAVIWFTAVGFFFYGFPTAIYEKSLAPNEHKGKGNLMVTIKYFMNGKLVDIEVTEEFAKQYERIVAEEKRLSWKNAKRSESSLEVLLDAGFQAVDPTENVEEHFFSEFERQRVIDALKQLEPAQRWLIEQVFFYDRKQIDIANELGVRPNALHNKLDRILKNLKKILN